MDMHDCLKRSPLKVVLNARWSLICMGGKINMICKDCANEMEQFVCFWWDFSSFYKVVPLYHTSFFVSLLHPIL